MSKEIEIIYILVSILSIFLYILSVQFKKKKHILITQLFASLSYLIIYVIKGAWAGVAVEVLEESKDVIFIEYEKKKKDIPIFILILFIISLFVVTFIFYDGYGSLLPLIINIILFVSTYFKNPKWIRYVMVLCGFLWGCYNFYVGAYIILIGNALEIISAIISIYRFKDVDNKKITKSNRKTKKTTKKTTKK